MAVKKRSKISAEFSMSSLTDIIFLLLIFFMLTSNFVQIKPFDLPESNSTTVAPTNIVVQIEKDGTVSVNNKKCRISQVERNVKTILDDMKNKEGAAITIVAERGVPFNQVSSVIKVAGKLRLKAILATQPI